ncbi:hypothetical protein CGMCC3_g14289 [Colletotrichum fructicola]|nr:uncharacterized protein CGMCC3_g14289 [Colletotrichum fructicola]KAE9569662.1 hypothetical protein CGMCC3_g14289 [Colletotrichum fructicola]
MVAFLLFGLVPIFILSVNWCMEIPTGSVARCERQFGVFFQERELGL